MPIQWNWKHFEQLSGPEMHTMLSLRQGIFVVEQGCAYQDADVLDRKSWHLMGCDRDGSLMAYARINFPGTRYEEPSIGRVLVSSAARGIGVGRQVVSHCVLKCDIEYPFMDIRISAQTYLKEFYEGFGFVTLGHPYSDEGVDHVDMVMTRELPE